VDAFNQVIQEDFPAVTRISGFSSFPIKRHLDVAAGVIRIEKMWSSNQQIVAN
jgi:hypothetical protein